MNFKFITQENIPCWYEISWLRESCSLLLKIHNEFIENKKIDLKNAPIVKHFIEELKLPEFEDDFNKDIGFGGIFKRVGKDDFTKFLIKIPQVKKWTENKCDSCNGTGKREVFFDEERDNCLFCEGSGKEWIMDWREVTMISATLTILTTWLLHCEKNEKETISEYPQMMTFNTITQNGLHGGSINGEISVPFSKYLKSFGEHAYLPEVTQAMKESDNQMMEFREYNQFSFNSYVKNGRFIINCPGDACGLHPSDWYQKEGEGFEFSCHNVDSAVQQLTLLVGLAKLCDMAKYR